MKAAEGTRRATYGFSRATGTGGAGAGGRGQCTCHKECSATTTARLRPDVRVHFDGSRAEDLRERLLRHLRLTAAAAPIDR